MVVQLLQNCLCAFVKITGAYLCRFIYDFVFCPIVLFLHPSANIIVFIVIHKMS